MNLIKIRNYEWCSTAHNWLEKGDLYINGDHIMKIDLRDPDEMLRIHLIDGKIYHTTRGGFPLPG